MLRIPASKALCSARAQTRTSSLNLHYRSPILHAQRPFSSSLLRLSSAKTSDPISTPPSPISPTIVYNGPLTKTFRSLKIFSLSSMGLAAALTPFMFIIDTSLPFVARVALASTAMVTSGVSTGMVAWCGHPYVSTIRTLSSDGSNSGAADAGVDGIQLETLTLTLRSRYTNVYDSAFLTETRRPFAKWELAESLTLQRSGDGEAETPAEETVAETLDAQGRVLGRWIVSWSEDGTRGTCRGEGKVQRFFNVHEEMLPPSVR